MISMDKKYRTRRGEDVVIFTNKAKHSNYPVIGMVSGGDQRPESWAIEGFVNSDRAERGSDLIEINPYEDFEIDEKVLVRNDDSDSWQRRHFAGVNNDGKAMAWNYGDTSFTSENENHKTAWNQCKKWSEDDEQG